MGKGGSGGGLGSMKRVDNQVLILSKARSEGCFTYSKEYILIKILQKKGEGSRITSKF